MQGPSSTKRWRTFSTVVQHTPTRPHRYPIHKAGTVHILIHQQRHFGVSATLRRHASLIREVIQLFTFFRN